MSISIPGYYIIQKTTAEGIIKEQYANVDNCNKQIYEYNYGYYGYHVGYCSIDKIRHMTKDEKKYSVEHKFVCLPQQFYQSIPEY